MRVLVAHNSYQQYGGEDSVFAAESRLLETYGDDVVRFTEHNARVHSRGVIKLVTDTIWNAETYRELRQIIRDRRVQVAHFHNTFPLISPSAFYAAKAEGVPVVVTLHNYRLLCPNGLLFRDGGICEDCVGRLVAWPGVIHGCYRGSRAATGVVTTLLTTHKILGTWKKAIDMYIVSTPFAREKFIEGGLPEDKIVVKPNFVPIDPGIGQGEGGYALFVGRLSTEKGLDLLLAAWDRLTTRVMLKVVGDGPLRSKVEEASRRLKGIEFVGWKRKDEVYELMKKAALLVFPSMCYENFPMTIAEAYATGLPVVASNLGAMEVLIDHGRTGLHFRAWDAEDLAAKVEWLLARPATLAYMRREARTEYEANYTAERNYNLLISIYHQAIMSSQNR